MKTAKRYTEPKLVKGPEPKPPYTGSTKEKEWAKNEWYINYSFNGKQFKVKEGLNRIKDHVKKKERAEALLLSITEDLKNGYDPTNPKQWLEHIMKERISLSTAVRNYIRDIETYNQRPKTIQSYYSKLKHLVEAFPDVLLTDITTNDIQQYIAGKIKSDQWTPNTVNAARRYFTTFFNWCIQQQYITDNPVTKVESKRIRSEHEAPDRHIPFTEEDAKKLIEYLDEHDPHTAFFCKFIYSTCLRPVEICRLRLKDIDLTKRVIVIPYSATKATKKKEKEVIHIDNLLYPLLQSLKLNQYPKTHCITSKSAIVGPEAINPKRPYDRVVSALKKLNLEGKGYTLYSFKHYSNIKCFRNGWELDELVKRNRHTDIEQTLRYLKDITRFIDITDKEVPQI